MEREKYIQELDMLEQCVRVGERFSKRLQGRVYQGRLIHHDAIFTSMICYAINICKIAPKENGVAKHELWDLPSICALTRCLIDAHDMLEYASLAEVSEEEADFRDKSMELHDICKRIAMSNKLKSRHESFNDFVGKKNLLKDELISHAFMLKLEEKLRKNLIDRIKNGNVEARWLSNERFCDSIGTSYPYWRLSQDYLSQYVHCLPMAMGELSAFKAQTPESFNSMSIAIRFCRTYFSRALLRVKEVFFVGEWVLTAEEEGGLKNGREIVELFLEGDDL